MKKAEPDVARALREIARRAAADGVSPREYLDATIRRLEAARRAEVLEKRERRKRPN